jgi:hypothetical protein
MKSAGILGPGAEGRERTRAMAEASAYVTPGSVILAAGHAFQDRA